MTMYKGKSCKKESWRDIASASLKCCQVVMLAAAAYVAAVLGLCL